LTALADCLVPKNEELLVLGYKTAIDRADRKKIENIPI
jgi:hypothetical protein